MSHYIQWGAGGQLWSFFPFLRYFALGNWKEAHTHLAKLIWSLGMGTFTSSGHQARSLLGGHATSPIPGGHQRVVQVLQISQVHSLCCWMPLSLTGTHVHVVLRLVGSPGLLWQIETNLQFQWNCRITRHGHPLPCAE